MPGGMEQHVAQLTAAQRRLGVRVTQVHNSGEAIGEAIRLWPLLRTDRLRPNLLRWSLFYFGALFRQIDTSDCRVLVLHVHGDWQAFLLGRALAARLGVNVRAATLHEWVRGDQVYATALRTYAPIFCTGANEAKRLTGITGSSVIHLPSAPADLFFARSQRNNPIVDVIAVGTLNPRKNYDLLLDCAALLPRVTFAIYGDGPERGRLEQLSIQMRLKNVQFRGPASPEAIRAGLSSSRLFINTAFSEGSPTAALEAMACGLPVVLTPSNDYSSIVTDGLNGKVTGSFEAGELASAIEEFIGNPDRLEKARRKSLDVAALHRWDAKALLVTNEMMDVANRLRHSRA